jgi:hypothetical protein
MGGHLEYGGGAASVAPFFFYGFLMRTRGVEAEGEGKGASGRQAEGKIEAVPPNGTELASARRFRWRYEVARDASLPPS